MNKLRYLVVLFFLVLSGTAMKCGMKEFDRDRKPQFDEMDQDLKVDNQRKEMKKEFRSGKGVLVKSWDESVDQWQLDAIDKGFEDLYAKTRAAGYDKPGGSYMDPHSYEVVLLKPSRTTDPNGEYSPDLEALAGPYWGSEFSHPCTANPEQQCIYWAGQIRYAKDQDHPVIFIGDHDEAHKDRLSTVTMYEGEHNVLRFANPKLYGETVIHGAGKGHPIF